MSAPLWVAVGLLGGAGSVARMLGTLRLGRGSAVRGTLLVNLTGAFALGVLSGAAVDGDASLLVGTALLGALTTFSTWMHEGVGLWQDARRRDAVLLVAGATAGGLAVLAAGRSLGALL